MAKAFELKDRKRILARYIETCVFGGFNIAPLMGRPLGYFNYSYLIDQVNKYDLENDNEVEFLPLKS